MPIWIVVTIAAIQIINSWLVKWVELDSKIPDTLKTKNKSSVYIRKYRTGILTVLLVVSVSTLAYLMFSTLPITRVTILLTSLNVCAIFMMVFSWVLIVNNERLKKLIVTEAQRVAVGWDLFLH